jgi:hypothetical protein
MPEMFRRLARANVTVYSIDPCGLGGFEAWGGGKSARTQRAPLRHGSCVRGLQLAGAERAAAPGRSLARHKATIDMDFLQAASANTGGRAIVNTNDFEPGLNRLFEENGSYYLVGYVQPATNKPGHPTALK